MTMDKKGFTLVELMITMVIFVLVIAGATQVFTGLLTQFKQQGTIAETNISGAPGLRILRHDMAQAGYGLPWNLNGATYKETTAEHGSTPWTERNYNDGPYNNPTRGTCPASPTCADWSPTCDPGSGSSLNCSNPPAPFRCGDDVGISDPTGLQKIPNSQADVLIIKSATVGMDRDSQRWTYLIDGGAPPSTVKIWDPPSTATTLSSADCTSMDSPADTDDLGCTAQAIVIDPGYQSSDPTVITQNVLQKDSGGNFYATLNSSFSFSPSDPGTGNYFFEPNGNPAYPTNSREYVIYGIADPASGENIRMPFNRADYYVKRPATGIPARCAPNTGILYKAVTNNTLSSDGSCPGGGGCLTPHPILDCVADMQVTFYLDTTGNGVVDTSQGDMANMTAYQIRKELKRVEVDIVAQEGQRDTGYDFSENNTRTRLSTNTVDLSQLIGSPEYKYYRWKLYTIVVQPNNMR